MTQWSFPRSALPALDEPAGDPDYGAQITFWSAIIQHARQRRDEAICRYVAAGAARAQAATAASMSISAVTHIVNRDRS
jgi:hypothetical protein